MNFTLLITVLLTAITLVVAAYVLAKLIGPRQFVAANIGRILSLRHLVPHV